MYIALTFVLFIQGIHRPGCLNKTMETSHLIHGNPVLLDVAKVVHLPSLTELHRQDTWRSEVPVDLRGLWGKNGQLDDCNRKFLANYRYSAVHCRYTTTNTAVHYKYTTMNTAVHYRYTTTNTAVHYRYTTTNTAANYRYTTVVSHSSTSHPKP